MQHCAHLILHTFVGIGSHSSIFPPAIPPVIAPHISMDTLLGLTIKAKYSKTVLGPLYLSLVGKDNDSGYIVPHISIPPTNVLLPIIIMFGQSKPMFSASTVKMDVDGAATPIAAAVIPFVPLSINQGCDDPCNYPSDFVISPNTVMVGLTLGDILSGVVGILLDVVVSYLVSKAGGKLAEGIIKRIGGPIAASVTRAGSEEIARVTGETLESISKDVVENVLERPAVKFAETVVDKVIEWGLGKVTDLGTGPLVDGTGSAVDGSPAPASTPAAGAAGAPSGPGSGAGGGTGASGAPAKATAGPAPGNNAANALPTSAGMFDSGGSDPASAPVFDAD